MCGAVVSLCGGSDSCQCWFAAVSERACLVRGCQNEKSLALTLLKACEFRYLRSALKKINSITLLGLGRGRGARNKTPLIRENTKCKSHTSVPKVSGREISCEVA